MTQNAQHDDIVAVNSGQIDKAASRTHALLEVALGTKSAPTLEEVRQGIKSCLDAAEEYEDEDYFQIGGVLIRLNREASPWPTFEVFVPATPSYYLRPTEG